MATSPIRPTIHRSAYFWPGLPQLWTRGSWAGLLVAVGFTALLNVLLLASLVYSEWLTLETQLIGYGALTLVWVLARWQSRAERRARLAVEDTDDQLDGSTTALSQGVPAERDTLLREAQGHYLRNDWVATEQLLLKLLKQDARDVESRLMLATLWRHQGRTAEARRQLDRVSRLEAAEKWQHEIAAERMALELALHEVNDSETNVSETNDYETQLSDAPSERLTNDTTSEIEASDDRDDENQRRAA